MSDSYQVGLGTGLVTGARAAIFYACNRFLLRPVYHDLQSLALPTSNHGLADDVTLDVELESLPSPTPSSSQSPRTANTTSLHTLISRLSFCLCFTESCILFLLFMCQELDVLGTRSRIINWKLSLFILMAMILFIIPLSQSILLTYQPSLGRISWKRSLTARVFLALVPYSLYLFALSFIPLPEGEQSNNLLMTALTRLVILGTIIMGLLSGLGAVRSAWEFLPSFNRRQRVPSEQELVTAEEALDRVRKDVQQRRLDERRLQETKSNEDTSWMSRVANSFTGNSELSSLQNELTGLVALEYQMDRNIENMKRLRAHAEYSRTVQGRAFRWAGRAFALYCIFRTLSSILNVAFPYRTYKPTEGGTTTSYPDLIAHFLTYTISLLPSVHLSKESISAISRQIGLALVGVIILSSIRFILKAVSRFLKLTSQNLGASLLLFILAQLMGTYLVSTLVQIRTAFPPPAVSPDSEHASLNVFSTLPAYEVVGSAFDYSYLLSAFATGLYLWIDERVNGSGSIKTDDL